MTKSNIRYFTFSLWWYHFQNLAARDRMPLFPNRNAYREYFDDGDTPEDALSAEKRALMQDAHRGRPHFEENASGE